MCAVATFRAGVRECRASRLAQATGTRPVERVPSNFAVEQTAKVGANEVEYILGAALVAGLAWFVVSDLGLPAWPWFEEHRAVRPVLVAIIVVLSLALLLAVASRLR